MTRLAEVEQHLTAIRAEAAALRGEGARLMAADGAPGYEVIAWLVSNGATDADARLLCVDIVRENRARKAETAWVDDGGNRRWRTTPAGEEQLRKGEAS